MTVPHLVPAPPPPPTTRAQLFSVFGNVHDYVRSDGTLMAAWENEHIVRIALPHATRLAGTHILITRVAVHRLIASNAVHLYQNIYDAGLWSKLGPCGGHFNFRPNRNDAAVVSLHAWALAHDWDPEGFPNRSMLRRDPALVAIFKDHGWMCGEDFRDTKDPMHFQYARGI